MEINHKCTGSKRGGRVFRTFFILTLFLLAGLAKAQESDSLKDSAAVTEAASDEGPSLKNLTKNSSAINAELAKIKEKERHDQIMSYIYMGVGFSIVIAIAWFTTALARKRQKSEDEKKALRLAQMKHHHKPHHHRR
jgi:hypothetical protein